MLSGVLSQPSITCTKVIGAPSGEPSGAKRLHRLHVELGERADGERRPFRELAEAAAKNPASLGQDAHRRADARRVVIQLDDVVAIGAEAELQRHAIADPPPILREHRELRAADAGMGQERRVERLFGQRAVQPAYVQLVAEVVAVVGRVLQVQSKLEHVLAGPVVLRDATAPRRTARS